MQGKYVPMPEKSAREGDIVLDEDSLEYLGQRVEISLRQSPVTTKVRVLAGP